MIHISSKIQLFKDATLYILLFLMLFVPYEFTPIKASLIMLLIIFTASFSIISKRTFLSKKMLLWCGSLICCGLLFVTWGMLNSESNAIKVLPVYVLWPVVYIFIICAISSLSSVNNTIRLFLWSTVVICLYSILFILAQAGIIPFYGFLQIVDNAGFDLSRDFVSYSMPSITSLLYLIPFLISALLLWDSADNMPIKSRTLYTVVIFSLTTMIFSSRRIFWIIVALSPGFTILFLSLINKRQKLGRFTIILKNSKKLSYIIFLLIASLAILYRKEVAELVSHIANSSIISDALTFRDEGTVVRDNQMHSLIESWAENPLFGAGHGASSRYCIRSEEFPWMYELSYFALLFQTGIVGFAFYCGIIVWVYYKAIIVSRDDLQKSLYLIPSLVGLSCFLVANATNSYLQAYDHMWTLFIPIAFINYFIINKDPLRAR